MSRPMRGGLSNAGPIQSIEEDTAVEASASSVSFSFPSNGRVVLSPGGHLVFVRNSVQVDLTVAPGTPGPLPQPSVEVDEDSAEVHEDSAASVGVEAKEGVRVAASASGDVPSTPYNLRVSNFPSLYGQHD